jgi:NADPH:quinone reductase-like Zn-dependent oxidoreductase
LQLLKSVFKVGRLITTVSTSKVSLVPKLIGEGVVDQIIDYKTQNAVKGIPAQSVDFLLDTSFVSMYFLPVMKPKTGLILTLTGKSGDHLKLDWPGVSWWVVQLCNSLDAMWRWRASRWDVTYDHIFVQPTEEDLDTMAEWYRQKYIKPIIGEKWRIEDIEEVRRVCWLVYKGKGGVGNYVLVI